MAILDRNGEVLEADRPMAIAAGGSVKLTFTGTGGRMVVNDANVLEFPRGEWIVLPLDLWQKTLAKALVAGGAAKAKH